MGNNLSVPTRAKRDSPTNMDLIMKVALVFVFAFGFVLMFLFVCAVLLES